jgi:NAD(P)-dependent dehydrogenase (short-subunit alcohol dehydrogenase family)
MGGGAVEPSTRLDGKVAIVTGAGTEGDGYGTGRASAVLLARAGADLVLVDRHADRAEATRRLVEAEGRRAAVVVLDLETPEHCRHIVDVARSELGGVDVLVSNAAAFAGGGLLDVTPGAWARSVAVNLTVPFALSQAAVPSMIERGGGSIVFLSTVVALRGPGPPAYAATKAGLAGLTVSIATSLGPQGIRANIVTPGMVDTPMRTTSIASAGLDDDDSMPVGRATATGRLGDAWDVAHAVLYLASPASRHVTGHDLPVDGGATVRLP